MALEEFRNEPLTDFGDPENVRRMEQALAKVRGEMGGRYPLVIGGEKVDKDRAQAATSPTDPKRVLGHVAQATVEDAERAVAAADRAFQSWQHTDVEERARYLLRTAAIMRRRKLELAAWMVEEVSKSWVEADADVAEAIDFAEYYARQMIELGGPHPLTPSTGEENELRYIALGVTVVIPPWNFPLAIMSGMSMAALVAGNTVVLKPASTSMIIAAKFVEIMNDEAHLPPGVLNFVPGPGGEIGDKLVDHPRTRMIAFTGSKEIGMRIFERAAKVHPGQKWLKRTILEMGGKDAQVVDETADLDQAADAIVQGAFGFQGQKCSACSRAIVVEEIYDDLLERVVEGAKKLTMGDPADRKNFMGAVIDKKAYDKIRGYIGLGEEEGRVVLGSDPGEADGGYFIPPTIVADVAPESRIAQEEIFGPVLAFIKARDFDHALEIANSTEFGLTGGVFSRSRERLERARSEFHVGNLYFNRKITGALVGVQPFGGFNMSGTDSKAGGPDYLLLFTQAKSVADRL